MLLAHRWRGKGGTSHPARAGGMRPLQRCGAAHLRGSRLWRTHACPGKKRFDLVRATADGQPAILTAVVWQPRLRAGADRPGNIRAGTRLPPHCRSSVRVRTLLQHPDTPIAAGRPMPTTCKPPSSSAGSSGRKILAGDPASVRVADLQDEPSPEASVKRFAAFVREFSARQAASPRPFVPEYRADLCSGCGTCIAACPAEAIGSDYAIDPARCIACCACVKACPVQARRFLSPFARPLAENFSLRKSPRWVV